MKPLILNACAALILSGAAPFATAWELPPMRVITLPAKDPLLNKTNLDRVKRHILALGERCTYGNKFNHNPCWMLPPYQFYLDPDPGPQGQAQWNINCDPARGDFNTLVVGIDGEPLTGAVDFRPNEVVRFHTFNWPEQARHDETQRALAVFRRAFSAAREALNTQRVAAPGE